MVLKRKLVNLLFGIVFVITVLVIGTTSVAADTGFIPFIPVDGSTASGTGDGQLSYPHYLVVDRDGNVYVSDNNNNRIQKFDSYGNYVTQWGTNGTGDGQFSCPMGIAVDSNGNVYVADYINSRVQKFDSLGNYVTQWGRDRSSDGWFDRPDGVAVDSNDNVYVTDNCRHCIQKFDSNGVFLAMWGSSGTGDGQFSMPAGIAVDNSGNIYVSDNGNNRIQKLDSLGNYVTQWGSSGTGDGQFSMPYGIAVDSSNNVYVVDGGNNRIQKFDSNGTFREKWGSNGSDIGQFFYPKGMTVDSSGNVYVVDYANQRVQVLTPRLEASSTIKGQTITSLGRQNLILDYVTAGTLTITGEQAADTTNVAPYVTLFDKGSADAAAKVVKYAVGGDISNFDTDTAYAGEAVANGDFFIVRLTATEGTKAVYYKINVAVTPTELTSFAFDGLTPAVTGVVDSTAKTIKFLMPSGTDVTKLTPTIIYTGKSVLPASGTEQDFTNPVKYTFVDFDNTTQDYYVMVCTEFGGGDGSEENPYQITRLEHLNNMRNHLDKHFILMNDLNFSLDTDYMDTTNKTTWTSGTGWTPVGTDLSRFTGSFDGGGHTIAGLTINSSAQYLGLFGYIASGAEVKDIILDRVSINESIKAGTYVGGLAGLSDGAVTCCGVSGSVTGYVNVGGLIGSVTGTVRNSYSTATVNGVAIKGSPYKGGIKGGGLVGLLSGTSAEITGSYSSGSINRFNFAGGLVGDAIGSEIRYCYSTANVSNGLNDIGGLVGVADAATISNCYALGSLGLYLYPLSDSCQGGLVGYVCNVATVEYCYSAGSVTGIHPGGLIGNLDSTGNTLTASFYDSVTSGCSDTGNGEPKTPVEMRTAGIFTSWDFDTVWDIVDTETNCSYPYLRAVTQNPVPGYGEKVPISEEPGNATVMVGENTSFTVMATGDGLAYQWQVDTGSGFTDILDDSMYSGAATATLSLTAVSAEMDGNKYRVIVSGTGVYPKTSHIAELTVRLNTPVINSIRAGDKYAVITWDLVANATGYIVFSSTTSDSYGAALETVSGSVYSCDATGLTNGTTYYFAVKATCGGVESDYSSQVSATPQVPAPGAPVLESAVSGDEYVSITWSEVTGATGYKIFSSTASGEYGDPYDTVAGSVYSCDVTGLENGTTYHFVVSAENPGGDSRYSNEVSATPQVPAPGAPVLESAVSGNEYVSITWSKVTGATGYKIFSSTTSGEYGDPYDTVAGYVYSCDVTGLENGTTYHFVVSAENPGGDSGYSNEISVTPMSVPGAPTDIIAEAGNRQVIVSFTEPSDIGGSPITGYIVTAYPGGINASGGASPITVTGLTNGTAYTFTVRAVNAVGEGEESEASSSAIPYRPSDGDDTEDEDNKDTPTEPAKPSKAGVEVLVNGRPEIAATSNTITTGGKTVTTVTVDDKKVEDKLQAEGNNAVVTIPVMNSADVAVGQLNGQTVRNMEAKEAVLEIKTENVTYTLPAAQINIDDVSSQIGEQVELKDIAVNISISATTQDTVRIIEDTANRNNYQIVVQPVEFSITCTNGNKTVEVSKFNGYVERMVAIPEGVDPNKITTGIVLNVDGTFSHVPTKIVVVNGKYYAKINSLTNSIYSFVYSPKNFKDVENHWAKDEVNDLGSRLVIGGTGGDKFEPDRSMTRAEFAAVVVKALGLMRPGEGKDTFNDVTKADWYYDTVSIAYEYGIISGYGSNEFGPADKVTREQAMIMISRAMDITGLKPEPGKWKNEEALAPKDKITRAEAAVIIRRLLQASGLI